MTAFWNKFKKNGKNIPENSTDDRTIDQADKKDVLAKKNEKKSVGKDEKINRKKKTAKIILDFKEKADFVNRTIIKPVISENAMTKENLGKYVFVVSGRANKKNVAEAISIKYDIQVKKVNIINYKSKARTFKMNQGKISGYKKAIVTVESGKKIELFSSKN